MNVNRKYFCRMETEPEPNFGSCRYLGVCRIFHYKDTRDKCQRVNSHSRCLICPGDNFSIALRPPSGGGYTSLPLHCFSSTTKARRGRCGAGLTPVWIGACFPEDEELIIGAVVNSVLMVAFVFGAML